MAETSKKKVAKRRSKKPETVRERAAKSTAKKQPRKRKLSTPAKKAKQSSGTVAAFLKQNVQTHSHSDESRYSTLTKHRSFMPPYLRNAWFELKNVVWPSLPEALRLTSAVIIFAAVFTAFIYSLDWLLGKAFEELILNESENIKEFIKGIF